MSFRKRATAGGGEVIKKRRAVPSKRDTYLLTRE